MHIKTDGRLIPVHPENGSDFSLPELQGLVGGYIEVVYLDGGWMMVVNEEGLLKGLPDNPVASIIAGQGIVGDVLVCKRKEIK